MLCSRANTREEAAMSGSIAAFVLDGFFTRRFASRSGRIHHPTRVARVGTPVRSRY
jgi:hypothetical protein